MVCLRSAWFENRPHLTPSIHPVWNPKHVIVQWVGIGTHTLHKQWSEENFFSQMKISSILRRFWISKFTDFMPQHLEKYMTRLERFRGPSSCFSHGFIGDCHMMPPPSSISVEKRWTPLPKSMRTTYWSLLCSLLTFCSVMNIGVLSRIWHLPARQTLTKVWLQGFSWLNYSGWFRVYWAFSSSDLSPMDSKSGHCLKAWSVRRGILVSKSWSVTWWKQWRISQRRHCVIQ